MEGVGLFRDKVQNVSGKQKEKKKKKKKTKALQQYQPKKKWVLWLRVLNAA